MSVTNSFQPLYFSRLESIYIHVTKRSRSQTTRLRNHFYHVIRKVKQCLGPELESFCRLYTKTVWTRLSSRNQRRLETYSFWYMHQTGQKKSHLPPYLSSDSCTTHKTCYLRYASLFWKRRLAKQLLNLRVLHMILSVTDSTIDRASKDVAPM